MRATILIVEDEELLRRSLAKHFARAGHAVLEAADGEAALALHATASFELALVDLKLPGIDGLEVLARIKARELSVPVIMMTAANEVEPAVAALKGGAYDYVKKPFDADDILRLVENALGASALRRELAAVRAGQSQRFNYIVTESPKMRRVLALVEQLSRTPRTPALVVGETGTGKEVIARQIHNRGARAEGPFVAVNCSALPETLLESELFGHVRGAFTDARRDKRGLFEQADGGTLFLDEIADMKLSLQPKILRALEERTVRRLGGAADVAVNVRVIAASNRELAAMVREGSFREDLYYRLNVFTVHVPPLRERPEDILPLARYFREMFNAEFKKNVTALSPAAEAELTAYRWPGNVRELRNVIERALILTAAREVPSSAITVGEVAAAAGEELSLAACEKRHILAVMAAAGGNRSKAARLLGISRTTLWAKLKEYRGAAAAADDS